MLNHDGTTLRKMESHLTLDGVLVKVLVLSGVSTRFRWESPREESELFTEIDGDSV